jgi:hypothetical protein
MIDTSFRGLLAMLWGMTWWKLTHWREPHPLESYDPKDYCPTCGQFWRNP